MTGKREQAQGRRSKKWIWGLLCLSAVTAALTSLVMALDQAATQEVAAARAAVRWVQDAALAVNADQAAARLAAEEARRAAEMARLEEGDPYFSDAVFIGDSRTEALYLYGGAKEAAYFYFTGATVLTVLKKDVPIPGYGTMTVMDAAEKTACGKIYLMLGINELGWPYPENFVEQYGRVIDRARADHPDATIAVQSILPVSAYEAGRRGYVNNERIAQFNVLLQELAAEKGCVYLDVASALTGGDGALPRELTSDGIHPNAAGCRKWIGYLRENPV